jgi:soluble lytic murein transglycosylase-like protein
MTTSALASLAAGTLERAAARPDRRRSRGQFRALQHALAAAGLLAVMFFILQAGEGLIVQGMTDPREAGGLIRYGAGPADDTRHHALASYMSKRYRVAQVATESLVGMAHDVGKQVGLDPLLILAVMAVESRLNPIAESEFGAKGLMQVIPKYHRDKFEAMGGEHTVLDPLTNVTVGARILKEYIRRTGNLESGLQFYNGALSDTSSEYAQKVIAEQERLRQAVQRGDRPVQRPSSV